jgi:hypothetical protein
LTHSLIIILVFTVAYLFKGGQLNQISSVRDLREGSKILDRLLDGKVASSLLIAVYFYLATQNVEFCFLAAAAWLLGVSPGLGRYVQALNGAAKTALVEWEPIDQFIENLTDKPRLWGAAGLALRGVLTVLPFVFLFQAPLLVLYGLTMPICYFLSHLFQKNFADLARLIRVWVAEILFGVVLGVGFAGAI